MSSDPQITLRRDAFEKKPVDGQALKKLIEASLTWLRTNQQMVNSLNVFPVPDGDTGTNMVLTMQAAYDEISASPERNFRKDGAFGRPWRVDGRPRQLRRDPITALAGLCPRR